MYKMIEVALMVDRSNRLDCTEDYSTNKNSHIVKVHFIVPHLNIVLLDNYFTGRNPDEMMTHCILATNIDLHKNCSIDNPIVASNLNCNLDHNSHLVDTAS